MNINLLIDAIVRQTTVLIGQLATAAGARAPLAHTANQVFMDLVRELKEQGLGNKVIADMFGLTLRTYHNKVARLSESSTERGRSLWEALLAVIQEEKNVLRSDLLKRFPVTTKAWFEACSGISWTAGWCFAPGAVTWPHTRLRRRTSMGQVRLHRVPSGWQISSGWR